MAYLDPSGHALEGSAAGDDPYRNRDPSRYYGPESEEAPAETDYMAFYEYQYGLRAVDPNPIVGIGGWLPGEELECAAYAIEYRSYTSQAGYSSTQEFVDNVLPFLAEAYVAVGMTAVGMGSDLLGAAAMPRPKTETESSGYGERNRVPRSKVPVLGVIRGLRKTPAPWRTPGTDWGFQAEGSPVHSTRGGSLVKA